MAFDILPFGVQELAFAGAADVASVGAAPAAQSFNMGLIAEFVQPGAPYDSVYDVIVETATTDDPPAGVWSPTGDRINAIAAPGTFRLQLANPVIDKVRARVIGVGATPANATIRLRWFADREGLALNS